MTNPPAVPPRAYRPDIDGLRALAVLLVLIFHFHLLPLGEAGFVGVDVFFVISGYLITGILLGQLARDSFDLRMFYVHRVRRLAPALLSVLLMVMLFGSWLLLPEDFVQMMRQVLASQWYAANIYFWRTLGYFGLSATQAPLLHMWSLAVEEQFYLFYPLALWGLYRWLGRVRLGWALLALAVLSFGLNLFMLERKAEATFYLLPTRAWELLAGGLLHWLPLTGLRRLPGLRYGAAALGWLGLALIVTALLRYGPHVAVPGSFALWPVGGALCLILAGTLGGSAPGWVSRGLSLRPVVYIGRISYPAYLVHWPVHVFATQWLADAYDLPWRWGMFVLSLVLAAGVLHGVEEPIRQGRWLPRNRPLLWGYAISVMIGLGVWGVSEATGGLPQRFTPEVGRLSAYVADRPALMPDCEVVPSAPDLRDACVVGVKNRQPSWIIVGDSHAWALHPALQRWMTQNNVAAVFVFNHGCPPLFGVHLIGDFRDGCYVFQQKVQALGLAHPELRSVLLISTWLQASEGALGDSPRAKPEDSLAVFARQFPVTMQWWHGQGRQVHVWGPLPGARRAVPPSMAMAARWGADSQSPLAWRRADYDARYAFFHTALSGSQQWVSRSIDPASRVCGPQPQDECLYALDGVPLYYDTNHPSRSSASVWADLLVHSVPHTGS